MDYIFRAKDRSSFLNGVGYKSIVPCLSIDPLRKYIMQVIMKCFTSSRFIDNIVLPCRVCARAVEMCLLEVS